jgi:ATP-dependent RNA helicase DDX1
MAAFEELGLPPELIAAIEDIGWQLPTPVQAEAIPLILGGGDVMAVSSCLQKKDLTQIIKR